MILNISTSISPHSKSVFFPTRHLKDKLLSDLPPRSIYSISSLKRQQTICSISLLLWSRPSTDSPRNRSEPALEQMLKNVKTQRTSLRHTLEWLKGMERPIRRNTHLHIENRPVPDDPRSHRSLVPMPTQCVNVIGCNVCVCVRTCA